MADFSWLNNDGTMANLIRSFDWSKTSLGNPDSWPQSLKFAINLLINTGIPMRLSWGKDFIQFYNDAYIPILGDAHRHPQALGEKTEVTWHEVWPTLEPMWKHIIETGGKVDAEAFNPIVERNGYPEEAFFTLSYSPVYTDDGTIGGILVTAVETTKRVKDDRQNKALQKELYDFFMQTPAPMCILMGPNHIITMANKPYVALVERDVEGKTLREVFAGEDIGVYIEAIDRVYALGEPLILTEQPFSVTLKSGKKSHNFLNVSYTPFLDDDGKTKGIMVHIQDVTEAVNSRHRVEQLASELRVAIVDLENERRNFRNLFKQTPEMVCTLFGPEHEFDFANEAHIKALGFDATGMKVRVAQPESVEIHGILDEVYRTGVTAHLHEIPVTLGTKVRYFNLTYAARKDEQGKPNGIMILGAEITDQVEARLGIIAATKEAQTNLNKLYTTVHNLHEGLVFTDLDGHVTYMNPEALRSHEFSSVGEMNTQIETLNAYFELRTLDGVLLPQADWPITRVTRGEKFLNYELVVHRPDTGRSWYAEYGGTPVFDETGKLLMCVLSVRDISHRKKIEFELKEAVRARDEFLSIASHELRTPLTSLKMQLQMTSRSIKPDQNIVPTAERLSKVFGVSLKQIERLNLLIDDLLDVSRIQSGKMTFSFEKIDLNHLIPDLIERFHEQSVLSKSPIEFESSGAMLVAVDPFRMDQVVTNLISNALKYASGKPILVSLEKEQNSAVIKVKDFGEGIAKDKVGLIFNRFERVSSDTSISGLGLGLYISLTIVKAHGGEIFVESEVGKGSTFTVKLPFR